MLRFGHNTNELMVNIVTAYEDLDRLVPFVSQLTSKFSEITTAVNNINTRKADVSFGEKGDSTLWSTRLERKSLRI